MIKTRKGHTNIKGSGAELFVDLQCILSALRMSLAEELGEKGVEDFIQNAAKSTRKLTEDELYEELSTINSALKATLKALKERDECGCCECKCEEEKNG